MNRLPLQGAELRAPSLLRQPLSDVTPGEVEKVLKVNVEGVLWGIQAAAKKLKQRKQKGKIISASSIAGHDGFELLGVYSASKFAVRATDPSGGKGIRQVRYHSQRILPRHRRH